MDEVEDKFVRVRLDRIQDADLNLFTFDYDLTFIVFFLNAEEHVYGRFGGRDATSADARQSLAGLRYAMQEALAAHKDWRPPADPPHREKPRTIWQVPAAAGLGRGCIHCHDVNEALNEELRDQGLWTRDNAYRYPPPDNLGLVLEVDRGDVVDQVLPDSPAAAAGLAAGDVIERLNGVPVASFGDAQFALDGAPSEGEIEVSWRRDARAMQGKLKLSAGWRTTDLTWRRSTTNLLPFAPLFGKDLSTDAKRALGLAEDRLAFAQEDPVHRKAVASGIKPGDVVTGVDGKPLAMDSYEFRRYVRGHYLIGDTVSIDVLREGKPLKLPLKLK